jgi:para-aminobenzoate synthetase component 1
LKIQLKSDPKERAENIMIADLVRNDLSRIAKKNSVKVEELCGIHTFETVHHMISTISCELKENLKFSDILKATFPMGSMTGAPKISSMDLIEKHESFKRGLYSGSIGYFKPNGDFDFNVVIRSFLRNTANKYMSCSVGGAITIQSKPQKEYEECLVKVKRMVQLFGDDQGI